MRKLLAFLNNMDSRAWRTVWVSLALLAGVAALTVIGKTDLLGLAERLEPWLETLRDSGWALPATVVIFVATSFIGAPAIMLNTVCVLAFGPWLGSVYAMAGTIVSCTVHFWIGRWGGPKLMHRYAGEPIHRLSRFIARNDFLASAIVRSVPTAPPIVVNLAFGASHANFWRFIAGATVGSIPKIALVAIFGQAIAEALNGGVVVAAAIAFVVVGAWLMFSLAARKAVRADEAVADTPATSETGAGSAEAKAPSEAPAKAAAPAPLQGEARG
jgi:uncharacterized membrane protein YdjX (TVP38/TMEM64 family)